MFYCCGITEKGVMPHNEDAMLIGGRVLDGGMAEKELSAPFIIAVSDGVSGESSGELASQMCLDMVSRLRYYNKRDLRDDLMDIHRYIAGYSQDNPQYRNMQATLCGLAVERSGEVISFNVGDSRLYLYREGRLKQLTHDQSFVQALYDEGAITMEERKTHVHRNVIFPAFGNLSADPKVDIISFRGGLEPGDLYLLCTDGLTDYVSPLDIQEILELPRSLMRRVRYLAEEAVGRGGRDNVTVAALLYTDD